MKPPQTPAPALNSRIIGHSVTPISDDHDEKWGVPTLAELGSNPFLLITLATFYGHSGLLFVQLRLGTVHLFLSSAAVIESQ